MSHEQDIAYIGEVRHRQDRRRLGIRTADRRRHVYCIGKSGTGKISLIRNLLVQDIQAGRGAGVIYLHGDLAEELLDYIPRHRR